MAPPPALSVDDLIWVLGSFCALNRTPFDPELLVRQFPPPYTSDTLIHAARALGFRIKRSGGDARAATRLSFPCLVLLHDAPEDSPGAQAEGPETGTGAPAAGTGVRPAIVIQAGDDQVVLFSAGTNVPSPLRAEAFAQRYAGVAFQLALAPSPARDPDAVKATRRGFGFRWFIPELLKHRKVWRDVLIASLVMQLLALSTPLFTQVVIDKVIVHRTVDTLIVIAVGLVVVNLFTALLSWVRQYLVLHTGNRVDAVLGAAVFEHLFKLPPRYFEHRPTGVITARLRGVETIREFVASAAVTLILDLPFLVVFVALMFYYSVFLTLITLAIVGAIALLSLIMAPVFRTRLNEQFLLAARNQAFATEYVAGLETVKSLQMEPQIKAKYGDYLAEYLRSGFDVRQIANTYNVAANTLE
ncbi:MAG: peptidase domain-containing ABC transporter, partial [Gammaproteobacteria bacterium]|nr:peptidase domain-containing ABC transporter [Gammaproteobacteria bacterium]